MDLQQLMEVEVVVTVGTRVDGRTRTDTLAPVDLFFGEELHLTGQGELGKVLQEIAPSFNFSNTTISDGSDIIRPATLRGLGPDQALLLINGKRRHQQALVHVQETVGKGSAGYDLNAIPVSAIERVEILRDGAAAQYGSDAIAGVINIVLKKQTESVFVQGELGQTYEGDGENKTVSLNTGFGDEDSWINFTLEKRDRGEVNRLSSELDVMRQSLLFNGMEAIIYNINRRNSDLKLYEFGKTYFKYESGFEENRMLSLFVTGNETSENWDKPQQKVDLFSIKKEVMNTLKRLGILKNFHSNTTKNELFAEGLTLSINKKPVVDFGRVSKKVLTYFGIKQPVYAAEINWDSVLQLMVMNKTKFKQLPKFPSSRRDLSLLIDKSVKFEEIEEIATRVDRKILKEVGLFDIYEGKNLEANKKSYAVSFLFQDEHKTLVDKQIEKIMIKIQSELETKLGASLR